MANDPLPLDGGSPSPENGFLSLENGDPPPPAVNGDPPPPAVNGDPPLPAENGDPPPPPPPEDSPPPPYESVVRESRPKEDLYATFESEEEEEREDGFYDARYVTLAYREETLPWYAGRAERKLAALCTAAFIVAFFFMMVPHLLKKLFTDSDPP